MKVLVTGGCGFIGSHIVDILLKNNHDVAVFDDLSSGSMENLDERAELYTGDLRNRTEIDAFFRIFQPEAVIHHAAQIDVQQSMKNPAYDCSVNIQGTVDLLDLSIKYGVRRFIYASTAAIYGNPEYLGLDENHHKNPESYYGYSKLVPETYIRMMSDSAGTSYAILRYANVFGPRQKVKGEGGVVAIFTNKMVNGGTCKIFGDGEQTRDFVYVKDVAKANLLALESDESFTVNISTAKATSVNNLFDIMKTAYSYEGGPEYMPARAGDIEHSWLCNDKAKITIGWKADYSIESGIKDMRVCCD